MIEDSPVNIPRWFWTVAIIALVWNLMGVMAYIGHVTMSPEQVAALSQGEQALREATPAWVNGVFAVSVFSGALGCIGLLLRKGWAVLLFIVSLVAVLVQNCYVFFLSDTLQVMGSGIIILPIVIITIAVFLVWFSRMAKAKGWLA